MPVYCFSVLTDTAITLPLAVHACVRDKNITSATASRESVLCCAQKLAIESIAGPATSSWPYLTKLIITLLVRCAHVWDMHSL